MRIPVRPSTLAVALSNVLLALPVALAAAFAPLLTAPLLTAPLAAQAVSPAPFATMQGNGGNTFPFGTWPQFVYQQIHTDLPSPSFWTQMSVRQGGNGSLYVPRTIDAELRIGLSNYSQRSTAFASNLIGGTTVMARKMVNLPDFTQAPVGGYPAPFNATFLFDMPHTYPGGLDLCWQLTVFANTSSSAYAVDVADFSSPNNGTSTVLGSGCIATGATASMSLSLTVSSRHTPSEIEVRPSLSRGVASAPAAVLLGTRDPNLPVPGLCSALRVDGVFLTFAGMTSASGSFSPTSLKTTFQPQLVGAQLYAQGVCADAGQPGIPVAVSNGRLTVVPPQPPAPVDVCRIYATNSATATTGSITDKYALIIEMR